ncbi:MAG: GntR family transcriptional regulator [Smithella sp.]|jgi:GntR family transcriptional repressor for pyruvate dehydrogenase complex
MIESIPQKIVKDMELAIFTGELNPHDRFPSERELAERYGVSRPVVREAMTHLTQLGLVKTVPKSGTYVADFKAETSLSLLIHIMRTTGLVDPDVVLSMLKVRRMAEPFVAYEVALKITQEELELMKSAGAELIANLDNMAKVSEADFNFHFTLIKIMNDLIIRLTFNTIKPVYRYYTDYYYTLEGTRAATISFVTDLLAALEARDPQAARCVMEDAVVYAEKRLMDSLDLTTRKQPIILRQT